MELKYSALLSPIKIGNMVLRNRMLSSASTPHFLQGTEKNPTEKVIQHFANRAKNGAALVTINHLYEKSMPVMGRALDNTPCHFNLFDLNDANAQDYFCKLLDAIHFYGSKTCAYIMSPANMQGGMGMPSGAPGDQGPGGPGGPGAGPEGAGGPPADMPPMPMEDTSPKHKDFGVEGADGDLHAQMDGGPQQSPSSYTKEYLQAMIEDYAQQAKDLKALGFDMISVYCCYRNNPMAKLLSPITNDRTDEYGPESVETRGRYMVEMFTALRKAVGKGFPLECVLSVDEEEFGGYTKEDTIQLAKMMEGVCDIFHLRSGDMDPQHPLGFTSTEDKPAPYIDAMSYVCKEIKKRGIQMTVAASAGFQDPEIANNLVADGGADLIYMARSWINNPDYGQKVYEGRKEDIVPCVRCNKCHVPNGPDLFRTVCTVNPIVGMEDRIATMVKPVGEKRKVAVVGGGPAGMEFARICAQRGHDVTLYEKSGELGGMLKHAKYPSFKWPLRQFMDYMIKEMDKLGVHVKLNTTATRELLEQENYQVLALALGAEPSSLPLPGKDGDNVSYAANIYGHEDTLGKNVTIIGGGEIGVETGLYLAELGHLVTVLEMQYDLILDAPHAHYRNMVVNYWRHTANFAYQAGVKCTAIDPDGVRYLDPNGVEQKQQADNVLLAIGMKSKQDEAMELAKAVPVSYVIGDCDKPGNVQKCMRSAFGIPSQI